MSDWWVIIAPNRKSIRRIQLNQGEIKFSTCTHTEKLLTQLSVCLGSPCSLSVLSLFLTRAHTTVTWPDLMHRRIKGACSQVSLLFFMLMKLLFLPLLLVKLLTWVLGPHLDSEAFCVHYLRRIETQLIVLSVCLERDAKQRNSTDSNRLRFVFNFVCFIVNDMISLFCFALQSVSPPSGKGVSWLQTPLKFRYLLRCNKGVRMRQVWDKLLF